ncbi:MAG: hypothetical protein Q8Q42_04380 [Nanoarchaeota archaeon]|nr:hypothetical protein [Nanoarchaeota archaeon]
MAYVDYIERDISISIKKPFNTNDVYKEITRWAKKHRYTPEERTYQLSGERDAQSLKIYLVLEKKETDYAKIGIDVTLIGSDMRNIKIKNKVMQEGSLTISFSLYIKSDYEDTWSRKNLARFLREFYDKFIGSKRVESYEKEAKNDLYNLKNALKDFFRAPKLKK